MTNASPPPVERPAAPSWEDDVRASAKRSANIRRYAEQFFALVQQPLHTEAQVEARLADLQNLQNLRSRMFTTSPSAASAGHPPAVSPKRTRRLPLPGLV